MAETIAELMRVRGPGIVGRDRELDVLEGLLRDDGTLIAYVHGGQGIGKSALVSSLCSRLDRQGIAHHQIAAGRVEPKPEAIVAVLADACRADAASIDAVAEALGAREDRVLIAVDDVDLWRLASTWMRRELVPSLPQNVRLVLAGRSPPAAAWGADFGTLLLDLPLGPLGQEDVASATSAAGLDAATALRVWELTKGHPLGMTMGIAAGRRGLLSTVRDAGELANAVLKAIGNAELRRAAEAAAIVRRSGRTLVGAILGRGEPIPLDAMEAIEALPFAARDAEGVYLAEPVRRAIVDWMTSVEPDRYAAWRDRAADWIIDHLRTAGPAGRWRYMADLLHLLDQPALRDAFFPPDGPAPPVEPARSEDVPAILALVEAQDGPDERRRIEAWLHRLPHRFSVARGPAGEVVAAYAFARPDDPLAGLGAADPVLTAWQAHAATVPSPGEVLFNRLMVCDAPAEMTAGLTACILDLKRSYIERWGLSRIYSYAGHPAVTLPIMLRLGFRPLDMARSDLRGSLVLDLPGADLVGWVAALVKGDIAPDGEVVEPTVHSFGTCRLDTRRRELTRDGVEVPVERQVFDLLVLFARSDGRVLSKNEILEAIWDGRAVSDDALTSRIKAARRAIGDDGRSQRLIRTVHRIGYQFLG